MRPPIAARPTIPPTTPPTMGPTVDLFDVDLLLLLLLSEEELSLDSVEFVESEVAEAVAEEEAEEEEALVSASVVVSAEAAVAEDGVWVKVLYMTVCPLSSVDVTKLVTVRRDAVVVETGVSNEDVLDFSADSVVAGLELLFDAAAAAAVVLLPLLLLLLLPPSSSSSSSFSEVATPKNIE